jgi:hypothetical protein
MQKENDKIKDKHAIKMSYEKMAALLRQRKSNSKRYSMLKTGAVAIRVIAPLLESLSLFLGFFLSDDLWWVDGILTFLAQTMFVVTTIGLQIDIALQKIKLKKEKTTFDEKVHKLSSRDHVAAQIFRLFIHEVNREYDDLDGRVSSNLTVIVVSSLMNIAYVSIVASATDDFSWECFKYFCGIGAGLVFIVSPLVNIAALETSKGHSEKRLIASDFFSSKDDAVERNEKLHDAWSYDSERPAMLGSSSGDKGQRRVFLTDTASQATFQKKDNKIKKAKIIKKRRSKSLPHYMLPTISSSMKERRLSL